MTKLSVVSPFYNESLTAARFAELLGQMRVAVRERFGFDFEAVLVDDGSTDTSAAELAAGLAGDWKIVRLSRNFGKEAALLAGIDHVDGDFVLLMDTDLQHSLETALMLISELVTDPDVDVVHGVRANRRVDGWRRTQLAKLFYKLINWEQRFDITENSSDFRVMRGPVARAFSQLREKRRFNKGLYAWTGFRQKAVPFQLEERGGGSTKWGRLQLIALSVEAFTSFTVMPFRVMSALGAVTAICGLLYGLKIILEVLFTGIAVPGFPSILVAVVVLGGFNLALLGLLGEYVWVAVSEIKDRPVYIVREVLQPPSEKAQPARAATRKRTRQAR